VVVHNHHKIKVIKQDGPQFTHTSKSLQILIGNFERIEKKRTFGNFTFKSFVQTLLLSSLILKQQSNQDGSSKSFVE